MTAAQAWHWIDPDRGAAKAAGVLRPGGQAALFWNRGRLAPDDRALLDPIYARLAPGLEAYSIVLGNRVDDRFEAAAAGLRRAGFAAVGRRSFPWKATYTTEGWLEHLQTHSDHRGLPPETLDRLLGEVGAVIDRRGGALRLDYDTWLVSGRAP